MISAMLCKEALKVYFKVSVFLLLKAYGFEEHFVFYLTAEASIVNAAKVDEVERAASHYKECINAIRAVRMSEVVYLAAVCRKSELTYTK